MSRTGLLPSAMMHSRGSICCISPPLMHLFELDSNPESSRESIPMSVLLCDAHQALLFVHWLLREWGPWQTQLLHFAMREESPIPPCHESERSSGHRAAQATALADTQAATPAAVPLA